MNTQYITNMNEKQLSAINAVKDGKNIFITGPAGSGKSYVVNTIRKLYGRAVSTTSTTGVSAIQLSGKTIHSWAGIGLGKDKVEKMVKDIKKTKAHSRWKYTKMLIIDEISMLSPELFDKLSEIGKQIRGIDKPFGGIQLILAGDFLQLPVIDSIKFCFQSENWDKSIDYTIYLDKIIRQKDKEFSKILEKVRLGKCTKSMKEFFLSRCGLNQIFDDGIIPTKLYSKNEAVDSINTDELDKLEGNCISYKVQIEIQGRANEYLINNYIKNDKIINLKVGAQVMLTENIDVDGGYANGSRGIITEFEEGLPVVRFKSGLIKKIGLFERTFENDECFIRKKQIPLRLAWAISIHKSQGITLDCLVTSLHKDEIFEYSMAYVALSRVKTVEGLFLDKFSRSSIRSHPKALEFYQNLKNNKQEDKPNINGIINSKKVAICRFID